MAWKFLHKYKNQYNRYIYKNQYNRYIYLSVREKIMKSSH